MRQPERCSQRRHRNNDYVHLQARRRRPSHSTFHLTKTSIPALAGMGQWRDLKVELKLSGGFLKAGATDLVTFDIMLRFYVNQL